VICAIQKAILIKQAEEGNEVLTKKLNIQAGESGIAVRSVTADARCPATEADRTNVRNICSEWLVKLKSDWAVVSAIS